jgi:hypothetical protein
MGTSYATQKQLRVKDTNRLSQNLPSNFNDLFAKFIMDYEAIVEDFRPELVINIDETSVSYDNSANRTFEVKGSKTIAIRGFKG